MIIRLLGKVFSIKLEENRIETRTFLCDISTLRSTITMYYETTCVCNN